MIQRTAGVLVIGVGISLINHSFERISLEILFGFVGAVIIMIGGDILSEASL